MVELTTRDELEAAFKQFHFTGQGRKWATVVVPIEFIIKGLAKRFSTSPILAVVISYLIVYAAPSTYFLHCEFILPASLS